MLENLPSWIALLFIGCWFYAVLFFFLSNNKSIRTTTLIVIYSLLQSGLAYSGFYNDTNAFPPRFAFVLGPTILMLIYTLLPRQRKWILQNRNIKFSTLLHAVRIPIEIVLLQLFLHNSVPELMTFEGRNFDIVAGITALMLGLYFLRRPLEKKFLIAWNYVALFLVLFILVNGTLSARLPFQLFAFDQPNIAIEYFPFILLPAVIVPLVIYTHITDLIVLNHRQA